jgi:hypothetical protein
VTQEFNQQQAKIWDNEHSLSQNSIYVGAKHVCSRADIPPSNGHSFSSGLTLLTSSCQHFNNICLYTNVLSWDNSKLANQASSKVSTPRMTIFVKLEIIKLETTKLHKMQG